MVAIKPFNIAYTVNKAKKAVEATAGGTRLENLYIKFKECQGETFNNIVTAVGTAGVAPIFIIHNPLAKEDKQTKEYTAARQPISALITIAAQVPIMKTYNNWLDTMAVKHHFDRCDLAAAPTKSYLKEGINQDYKDFLYKCSIGDPDALELSKKHKTKKAIKEALYQRRKNQAFYDELKFLRESSRNGSVPEYLAKSIKKNGLIKVEDMVSGNDIKSATSQLIADFFEKQFKVDISKDLDLPDKIKIDSVDSFKQNLVKKALKNAGIDFTKEHKKALKEIIKNDAAPLARRNVSKHLIKEARVKLYTHNIYSKAKEEFDVFKRQLLLKKLPREEEIRILTEKNNQILNNLLEHANSLLESAPEKMPKGINLNDLTINNVVLTKEEVVTLINKIEGKMTSTEKGVNYVKYLRTSEGTTFKELFKSVQIKRWLKAKINNSQTYLSDFKQKSGIIVGLAILPFTCGLLNWAYPRIMEEWFPHLANAKKASAQKMEAK